MSIGKRNPKNLREVTCSSTTSPTKNFQELNSGFHGEKPASNHLNYRISNASDYVITDFAMLRCGKDKVTTPPAGPIRKFALHCIADTKGGLMAKVI
jgi:hypothetical protein